MANNRLMLVYRPTGDAVFLGKRMSRGWHSVPSDIKERIEHLFDLIDEEWDFSQDDFCLCMEDGRGVPHVLDGGDDWNYGPDECGEITNVEIRESIPYAK